MKKRDEGYVLAFVLVVIVVICLVAVSMMTVSLRNLEAQTASVERMQDKYQALGLMEETITSVSWNIELPQVVNGTGQPKRDTIVAYLQNKFSTVLQDDDVVVSETDEGARFTAEFDLLVQPDDSSHKVSVSVKWTGEIVENGSNYRISESEVTYTSYEVVPVEQTQDGGGA